MTGMDRKRAFATIYNWIRTNAKKKPMHHIAPETQINRLFHLSAIAQAAASSGSAGHTRPVRKTAHPAATIIKPETANTQPLYMLSVISHGAELAMDATAAPKPTVTSRMGKAQQVSVADVVNKSTQLHDLGLTFISCHP